MRSRACKTRRPPSSTRPEFAEPPYSSLTQLQQSINQTEQLLTQAQRIAYSVTSVNQAFTQSYPQAYSSSTSSQQLLAGAQTRWQNALAEFQDAMRVQAGVVQNLSTTRAQIAGLVSSSQGAFGAYRPRNRATSLSRFRRHSSPTSPR